ncbi:histidine--tRNA ligase [Deinococcus multiflagellatus]|uniref:Histidine--tRNA ligase n=1 Tax=Deinococcus multiflagellatus TaxID=1656887 RepID=A0ABW1ZHE2_9DEIO
MTRPTPISGFPEFLPAEQLVFDRVLATIRATYERYGFTSIETPAVERRDTLVARGGDDKEIYTLSRLTTGSGSTETELALHFDLSVPLARYVAQHADGLVFPFQRAQIQKVWRGERPQAGRFREFYQADLDVVGRGRLGLTYDALLPAVISDTLSAIGVGPFCIRLNHRQLLQGWATGAGLPAALVPAALRVLDKLEKIGIDAVRTQLTSTCGLNPARVTTFLELATASRPGTQVLDDLAAGALPLNAALEQGIQELQDVTATMQALGVPDTHYRLDLSVARGLGYYTGTVYETGLQAFPTLGSICSGGGTRIWPRPLALSVFQAWACPSA